MKSSIVTVISILLIVSACSTPEERAARRAAEQERIQRMFENNCLSYGFKKETPAFRQCLVSEKRSREQDIRIAEAEDKASQAARKARAAQQRAAEIEDDLDWDCIMSGGVRVGGTCM